jgi:hypothetical protein
MTIADYWRVHEKFPQMDDDKGTSLVLVNTTKGESYWNNIKTKLNFVVSDYEDAIRVNSALVKSPLSNKDRARFFKALSKGGCFDGLVIKLLKVSLMYKCKYLLKRIVKKVMVR